MTYLSGFDGYIGYGVPVLPDNWMAEGEDVIDRGHTFHVWCSRMHPEAGQNDA